MHGLAQEVEELKKANRVLQEEKQWNVNRLMELEDQMGKFKNAIGDSIRKGGARSRMNSAYDDRSPNTEAGNNSRLHWPKMGGEGANIL